MSQWVEWLISISIKWSHRVSQTTESKLQKGRNIPMPLHYICPKRQSSTNSKKSKVIHLKIIHQNWISVTCQSSKPIIKIKFTESKKSSLVIKYPKTTRTKKVIRLSEEERILILMQRVKGKQKSLLIRVIDQRTIRLLDNKIQLVSFYGYSLPLFQGRSQKDINNPFP